MVTKQILVGRLVPIAITIDVESVLGDCIVCMEPLAVASIAKLDWQAKVLIHYCCVNEYIEVYMFDNPDVTVDEIQVLFGISRSASYRRLEGVRRKWSLVK